jgi:succinyl-CoA synthetase beta subunit
VNCSTKSGVPFRKRDARSLIAAAKEIGFNVPVVVRLEGTNVEIARKMLKEAKIEQLKPASDLTDAARQVCACV